MSLQINTPEAYKRLINNNVSKSVNLSYLGGGLELAKRIDADFPDVPIVFYSRKATVEDVIRYMAMENV